MRFGLMLCLATLALLPPCGTAAASDDDATIVIYRPKRFTSGAVNSSYRVNGTSLGGFKFGVVEVRVDPGRHEVRNFFPAKKEEKFDEMNGQIKWGTYVTELDVAPGETVWVFQHTGGEMEAIPRSELDEEFDRTPRRKPLVARVEGTFVTPGEELARDRCLDERNERDCRDYLERFPYGAFAADVRSTLRDLAPKPAPAAEPASMARTRRLPVGIQRDKYMLALTAALKEERYTDALFYFDELDRLEIELSPSFWFYWGEALYETGDYDGAIDKLYTYIAEAGSGGEHYHRALELSTEAEER